MLHLITEHNRIKYLPQIQSMHRLRKKIFCDQLNWQHANIRNVCNLEYDQFDTHFSNYLIYVDESGEVVACTRLISTQYPYLLGDIFPEIVEDTPVPRSPKVWETSRYCADTDIAPKTIMGILAAGMLELALVKNIESYVSISDIRIELIIARYGWRPQRLGNPINTGTDISAAEHFPVSEETYLKVCRKSKVQAGRVISNLNEALQSDALDKPSVA